MSCTTAENNTECGCVYVTQYMHYRAKRIIRAVDYGYRAFCFRRCAKHGGKRR